MHREVGGGLLEEYYQECLEIELGLRAIPFQSRAKLVTHYKSTRLKKEYISDLIVFGGLIVELKAVSAITGEHEAQLINYLRLSRQPVGYLINFAPIAGVEWKRFVLSEFAG